MLAWLHVVRLVGHTAKFSKKMLEAVYGREMNIKFPGNSSGGHSCSLHANCTRHKQLTSVTTAHLREAIYCPRTRCTCVMIMLFNHTSLYAIPVRWMDYLGNGEILTNRDANKCVHNISEK
jgi:hypothetical protein